MRENLTINAAVKLDAWLYRAGKNDTKHPLVVMSHGLAAVMDLYLDPFAKAFAAAGLNVLVFDHRGFGKSEGPRLDIDPWAQVRDTQDVISFAAALPFVDAARIGVWGTSFSGGHAIVLGAIDARVKSVVAQVPTVDGYTTFQRRQPPHMISTMEARFAEERARLFRGEPPTLLNLLPEGKEPGVFKDPEAIAFFGRPESKPASFEAKMTLLSAERARDYNPIEFVARVSPTPLLMIVADNDTVTGTDLDLAAYARALEPKALELFPGAHWSPYVDARERAITAATGWFRRTLLRPALAAVAA